MAKPGLFVVAKGGVIIVVDGKQLRTAASVSLAFVEVSRAGSTEEVDVDTTANALQATVEGLRAISSVGGASGDP
jgi:hypothetical protein